MSRLPAWGLAAVVAGAAGCGDGAEPAAPPDVITATDVVCDQDPASELAKDAVERAGGLVTESFTVRFARSTEAGVVALVDGDVEAAFDELTDDYGVAIVASYDGGDGADRVTGFARIDQVVEDACR